MQFTGRPEAKMLSSAGSQMGALSILEVGEELTMSCRVQAGRLSLAGPQMLSAATAGEMPTGMCLVISPVPLSEAAGEGPRG